LVYERIKVYLVLGPKELSRKRKLPSASVLLAIGRVVAGSVSKVTGRFG
jgi:hypothetical protein